MYLKDLFIHMESDPSLNLSENIKKNGVAIILPEQKFFDHSPLC
jgi:hypothetical protein